MPGTRISELTNSLNATAQVDRNLVLIGVDNLETGRSE